MKTHTFHIILTVSIGSADFIPGILNISTWAWVCEIAVTPNGFTFSEPEGKDQYQIKIP